MEITIKKLGGRQQIQSPSLATCFEFVSIWSTNSDMAVTSRLCAGALGVCLDHLAILPKYKPAVHKPSNYGHLILDRLLEKGISPSAIFDNGTKCLSLMATKIPTQEDVEEEINFSSPPNGDT
tara:strand:- start:654 stop:1022 length:369 start_codon:yes stop_codon:yes gene_type:complete